MARVTKKRFIFISNHKSGFELRGIPASAKTRTDIREEEYDRKYDDKNKKGIIIQLSYFFTKKARLVLVDVVFFRLHCRH